MLSRNKCRSRGFTLVELLVVIGIIAVLISLLLPALGGARRAANTVKCAANLRSIMQAMHIYASQNNGWMAGSANTSGLHYMTEGPFSNPAGQFNNNNCPEISHMNDWQAPLAKIMNIKFNIGGTNADRKDRFAYLQSNPIFQCPEAADLVMTYFPTSSGIDWGAMPYSSYAMAFVFTLIPNSPNIYLPRVSNLSHTNRTGGNISGGTPAYDPPGGYAPKLSKIKYGSSKIAMADGSRSTRGEPPTYDNSLSGSGGGLYADQGSWSLATRAWFRGQAPGNGSTGNDGRIFAYRHGKRIQGANADTFRMNIAFWDGHVSTMGDLESSDPNLWMPYGTRYTPVRGGTNGISPDTYDRFCPGLTGVQTIGR